MKILQLLALVLLFATGCSKKPDTLVTDGYDEKAMAAAISRAQQEVDVFITALEQKSADSFSVKAPITDNGKTEHFWLTEVTYKDGVFSGSIGNDPGIIKSVKFGQSWQVKKDEISDWMYMKAKKIHGGYTIDPLLVTMNKAEAEAMRARLVR